MSWMITGVVFCSILLITNGFAPPFTEENIEITTRPLTTLNPQSDALKCIEDECNPRLQSKIEVHTYELEYTCYSMNDTTIQGSVVIDFTLREPINQLIYHGKRMVSLDQPELYEDGVNLPVTMREYLPSDYLSLRLLSENATFSPNRYQLKQKFVVNLTDGNLGFYQSLYTDRNRQRGKLLSTKFQPTDARKAFPCFDEPSFKAIFKITIVHPENTIALSNFPSIEETFENGLIRTVFADTFRMSTYLAAWAILPNNYGKLSNNDNDTQITVWARHGPISKGHTTLALEIAQHSIAFYSEYFNTSEPVPPKTDLLAVPDFASGAMENWGLVSFREDRIMFDEKIVSIPQKQQLGETIAHEIAHFWFGNYVTCEWWNNLWLNEAMATWLSYKPFTEKYSHWNMEMGALIIELIPVMWDDGKPSSHAVIVQNVTDSAEITSLFDSITYSKGASILRMLEKIVGSDKFRDGLRDYLSSNAFDVGNPSIFYNNLFTNISGEEFMKSWLQEPNYPMVTVNLINDENGTTISFNQSRFIISNALDASKLNNDYRWTINVQCVLGENASDSNLISESNDTIEFFFNTQQETRYFPDKFYTWVKCNRDFQGFFATRYTSTSASPWQSFSSIIELQPTFFSDEDKINLLQDAFLLAYKGIVDYIEPLRLMKSLVKSNTKQYVIWRTFQWHWEILADIVEYRPDTWTKFRNFAINHIVLSSTTIDEILETKSTEDHNIKLLSGLKFSFLCRMDHKDAIDKARALFRSIPIEYFNGSDVDIKIGADFLTTIYVCHLSNDDNETDWTMMYNYYKIASSPQEQTRSLLAISSTPNKDRLNRLLNDGLVRGSHSIKRQDYFSMIAYMSRQPIGRQTAWDFYRNNFDRLVKYFRIENRRLGTAVNSIARSFEKESYLDEMKEFLARFPKAGAGASSRKQAFAQVNMNIEWIKNREANLRQALDTLTQ